MIKYNSNTINDWNFGDDNIIKVYRDGVVVYYKVITSGSTPEYKVCYAVVDDISQYSETEYEDVFDKATEKWYKLNNINEYEQYGVYASGRTSCSGSSRLPQGYTEVEYIENTGTTASNGAYINSGLKLYDVVGNSFSLSGRVKSEYYSATGEGNLQTIINSESVSSPYYGFTYRYKYNVPGQLEFTNNPSGEVSFSSTANTDGTNSIVINCNSTSVTDQVPLGLFASYNANYNNPYIFAKATIYSLTVVKNGDTVRDLVPAKRNSDSKYGLYDLITDTFYTSPNGNNFIGGSPVTPTDCVTTYEGKLTIDDGYEYIYSGDSWVNVGEVSGSSRVPDGYTELTYCTVPKQSTEKFVVPYELQPYYKYSMEFTPLDFWTSSYYAMLCADYSSEDNLQLFKLDNGWGTQWRRFSNKFENYEFDTRDGKPFKDKFTVFENVKAKFSFNLSGYTIGQGAVITVENEGSSTYTGVSTTTASSSYSPTYGIRTMYMLCGSDNPMGKTPSMKFHNFKIETSGGTAVYDYLPCKRESDDKVGIYDVVHNEFYSPSAFTLTEGEEIDNKIYPKYYEEKLDPLDNLSFSSMTEAQTYACNNCVYDGLKATIDGDRYYFDSSDENGWVKILSYYKFEDITPNAASGWTITDSATYNPNSSYYDDFSVENSTTSYVTKLAKITIYGYESFTYYLRSSGYSSYSYATATNIDEIASDPTSNISYSSSSAITNTYTWHKAPKSDVNLSNYRRVTYNNLDKNVEHTFYVCFYGRTYSSYLGNATILIPKEQTNENWEQVTFSASTNVSGSSKSLYIDGNNSTSGGTQYFYKRWMIGLPSGSHSSNVSYSNYNCCPDVTSSTFTSVVGNSRLVEYSYNGTTNKTLQFRLVDESGNTINTADTVYYSMTYYNSCGASSSSSNLTFPRVNTVKVGGKFYFTSSSNRHYIYGYQPNIQLSTYYYSDNYNTYFDIPYTKLSTEAVTVTYVTYDPNDVEVPAFSTKISYPYGNSGTSSTTLTSYEVPYTYTYDVSVSSSNFSADAQTFTASTSSRTVTLTLYPNNRTFSTIADMEAYQYAWEGMKAIVDDTDYEYKNGEWIEAEYTIWYDPNPTNGAQNAVFNIGYYWGTNYKMVIRMYIDGTYSSDTGGFINYNQTSPIEFSLYSNGFYLDMHNPTSTTSATVDTGDYNVRTMASSKFSGYQNSQIFNITLTYAKVTAVLESTGSQMFQTGSTYTVGDWYDGLYSCLIDNTYSGNRKYGHISSIKVYNANDELVNDLKFVRNKGVTGSQEISMYDAVLDVKYNNTTSYTPIYHYEE